MGRSHEVADEIVADERRGARHAVGRQQRLDLGASHGGVLVPRVEAGLDRSLRAMALGQEPRSTVEMLGGEGDDHRCPECLGDGHAPTVERPAPPRVVPPDGSPVVLADDRRRSVTLAG